MNILEAETFNKALCANFGPKAQAPFLLKYTNPAPDNTTLLNTPGKPNAIDFKYNAVFNSSGNCCIILDKHLNVVDFNDASIILMKKVFGTRLVVGQYIGNFLNSDLAEPILDNCMRALRGDSFTVERKICYNLVDFSWWQAEYSPAYNDMQHIAGLVFNATEISFRKAREIKFEEQNQKLRAISLMQSHDIRGPLCTMMGLMNLLKQEGPENSQFYLEHMEASINLLDQRIRAIVECASDIE